VKTKADTLARARGLSAVGYRSWGWFSFESGSSSQRPGEIAVNKQRPTDSLNPAIPVSIVKTELARSAVGDHRDCAVKFRLAEKPIDLEVAVRNTTLSTLT
jgi:hypothetical protein